MAAQNHRSRPVSSSIGGRSAYVWQVFRPPPLPPEEAPCSNPRALSPRWRPARRAVLLSAFVGVAAGLAGVLFWCLRDLPRLDLPKPAAIAPSTTVLAEDGTLLARVGGQDGKELVPDRLPKILAAAIVATEDRRFFRHDGIDPVGMARAIVEDVRTASIGQGGSTITQQLAKMLFLSADRTAKRKLQELVLAVELERRYSKPEILALYLNRAYFGEGVYGADAAARRYFGKPAQGLDLAEAAILAGALKAPSRYNLVADRPAAEERARIVLANMVAARVVTPAAAAAAVARLPHLAMPAKPPAGGYFTDWVIERVRGMPETWGRPIVVRTTLDAQLQAMTQARLTGLLAARGGRNRVSQGAVVVMTTEGDIKAMVGGRDYAQSPFNRATQALRQPGSTFKIFAYLAAMESGYGVDDKVVDAPVRFGGWTPDNYMGRYWGPVTLRTAFAQSLNSVAVRLAERIGIGRIAETARRLGIESRLTRDATLVLGSSAVNLLELTGAVATIAAAGIKSDINGIAEVRDADTGALLYRHEAAPSAPVIAPSAVAAMDDLMSGVVRSGTGRAARLDRPAAGKTGTSQDYRDAWFVGFTGDYVGGVWLGNDDGAPMHKVTGGDDPAALWRKVMLAAHAGLPRRPLRSSQGAALAAGLDAEAILRAVTGG